MPGLLGGTHRLGRIGNQGREGQTLGRHRAHHPLEAAPPEGRPVGECPAPAQLTSQRPWAQLRHHPQRPHLNGIRGRVEGNQRGRLRDATAAQPCFHSRIQDPWKNKKDERGQINGPQKFGFSGQPGKVPKTRNGMAKWLLGKTTTKSSEKWEIGPFAEAFPVTGELGEKPKEIDQGLSTYTSKSSPFGNAGYAWQKQIVRAGPWKNVFWTTKVKADYDGEKMKLEKVLDDNLDPDYEVDSSRIDEWRYAKGSKNEFRLRKKDRGNVDQGLVDLYDECMSAPFGKRAEKWKEHRHKFLKKVGEDKFYHYDEGAMRFDSPDRPSRTVVTDEIGRTPSMDEAHH